jgi:hypothetical protein
MLPAHEVGCAIDSVHGDPLCEWLQKTVHVASFGVAWVSLGEDLHEPTGERKDQSTMWVRSK